MCGIFGLISRVEAADLDHFHRLAQLNRQRGNLGYGYVGTAWEPSSRLHQVVYRSATPYLKPVVGYRERQTVALGHIRAPTGGRSQSIAEIHPFESGRFLLAHNGLLLNADQHPAWRLNEQINVDSQVLLGGILANHDGRHALADAISITAAALDGQQACWLWDKRLRQLYLWRVMSPIYIKRSHENFLFSSLSFDNEGELLDEGAVYRLNFQDWRLEKVAAFDFYSPYL